MGGVVEMVGDTGRPDVEFNAGTANFLHEPRRRVDLACGADAQEHARPLKRRHDDLGLQNRLTKPDDVRPPASVQRLAVAVIPPWTHLAGVQMSNLEELAVHVHHISAATSLVQVIDVLRDDRDRRRPRLLKPRQCLVRGVRSDIFRQQIAAAHVVEVVDQRRIPGKGRGRRHVLNAMTRPQASITPKRCQPARGADSRACQHDDRWATTVKHLKYILRDTHSRTA